jgi:pimeloyl-ACP methyl ester carboxylesterase
LQVWKQKNLRTNPPSTTCFLFSKGDNQEKELVVNGNKPQQQHLQTNVKRLQKNVNFCAPLLDYGYPSTVEEFEDQSLSEKPILLYLPGFDGTYICPFIQFPELGTEFEVWCMTVGMNDRSTFEELMQNVLDFIDEVLVSERNTNNQSPEGQPSKNDGNFLTKFFKPTPNNNSKASSSTNNFFAASKKKRPIYLVGESFGGILASEVALMLLKEQKGYVNLKGLVLINAATCYDRSSLASNGPSVAKLPGLLYPFGLLQMLPLFADAFSFEQLLLILQAKALPSVIDTPAREAYMGRVAFSLPTKLGYMSQDTLQWRLEEWLEVGCARMGSRMGDFRNLPGVFRTLIVAGEKDLTLPSIAEAERLANLLPNSQVHVVEGAGHASTCGSRMDMTAVMRARFPELQKRKRGKRKSKEVPTNATPTSNESSSSSSSTNTRTSLSTTKARTAMKPKAAQGRDAYFGMEPRYDGADIGLNPILYWSNENFRATQRSDEERSTSDGSRTYRKATYSIRRPSNNG